MTRFRQRLEVLEEGPGGSQPQVRVTFVEPAETEAQAYQRRWGEPLTESAKQDYRLLFVRWGSPE